MTRTTISFKWLIFICAIFLIILVASTKLIFGYNDEIVKGILVTLHGVLLEIILIVIVLEQVQRKLFQRQVKKVTTVIKPKIIGIIDSYKFLIQIIGQEANSTKLNWETLAKVDFLKKPHVEPWSGNTADYIKWSIERCENKIVTMIHKYSGILEFELLKNLETLIDHDFSMKFKMLPDVITMNREGYIKHHNEFKAFSLSPDQEKDRLNISYEEFSKLLKDINIYMKLTP